MITAMEAGATSDPAADAYLKELMGELEAAKKGMPPFTQEEAQVAVQKFANSVFDRADEEDRQGLATQGTARTFFAAAVFYDVMKQFGELSPAVSKRKLYAKWKAGEILKAVKEGRQPEPGGYGERGDEEGMESAPTSLPGAPKDEGPAAAAAAAASAPATATSPPTPASLGSVGATTVAPAVGPAAPAPATAPAAAPAAPTSLPTIPVPAPAAAAAVSSGRSTGRVTQAQLDDAHQLCQFALAAIKVKDANLSIQRMEQAISILRR